jgi:hypothetical protein
MLYRCENDLNNAQDGSIPWLISGTALHAPWDASSKVTHVPFPFIDISLYPLL